MSKVYSFRLNDNNPREFQASEVINAWISKGYSARHVITEALLAVGNNGAHQDQIFRLLNQIKELLLEKDAAPKPKEESSTNKVLSISFIESLKSSMKADQKLS
jgi:hypothetical protein